MTKFARWYYTASFITVLILLVGAGVVWRSYTVQALVLAPGDVNNVVGWAWSGNSGWISLNSKNCDDLNSVSDTDVDPCNTVGVDYGLRLTVNNDGTGGDITGNAWSENLGWICFGTNCSGPPPLASPGLAVEFTCNDGTETVTCDAVSSAYINGWAKIVSLGDAGWIKLSEDYLSEIDFGETSAGTKLDGYMWHYAGGSTPASAFGVGWIRFAEGQEVLFPYLRAEGGDIFSRGSIRTFFPAPKDIGNAQFLIHVKGSAISRFNTDLELASNAGALALCQVGNICRQVDYSLIVNAIDPTIEEPYNFQLGRFDFLGLRTKTNTALSLNKYGYKVITSAPNFSVALDNSIYVVNGDYQVDAATTIPNGNDASGAGTVIVLGDMIINSNIEYNNIIPDTRQELASVAWIVMGDVIINPSVTKVAGNFIVFGTLGAAVGDPPVAVDKVCYKDGNTVAARDNIICTNDAGLCSVAGESCVHKCAALDSDGYLYDGCGKFITGDPNGDNSQKNLTVLGTVFARQFILLRSYVNVITRAAAERFVADGRIQLNPPPGLSDFAKGLPTFRR